MFKKKQGRIDGGNKPHYWFTIAAANGQTLATSETYTTAAMRDKGIEAVKDVVMAVVFPKPKQLKDVLPKRNMSIKTQGTGWKVSEVKRDRRFAKGTFNLENKKGKIVKR